MKDTLIITRVERKKNFEAEMAKEKAAKSADLVDKPAEESI